MRLALAAAILLCAAPPAAAQHAGAAHHGHGPYAGQDQRAIKALSPEAVADLRAGRGMGLALAAELNGYPGPLHVLELAEPLQLTPDQARRTEDLLARMRAEAVAQGEQVLALERELDRLFAAGQATPERLAALLPELGRGQGELRRIHLVYHLAMLEVLSPEQVRSYARLRGYGHAAPPGRH